MEWYISVVNTSTMRLLSEGQRRRPTSLPARDGSPGGRSKGEESQMAVLEGIAAAFLVFAVSCDY